MSKSADDAPGLVKIDPWLEPYSAAIHQRTARYQQKLQEYGPLSEFATSHKDLGLHRNGNEWVFREWAPRAKGLFLTGDFCDWSREAHPLRRSREIGVWEVRLPGAALKDGDLYKVHIVGANGAHDRMPSHASFLVQDEVSKAFSAQVVDQPDFQWQ